jgi:hypothetical protein
VARNPKGRRYERLPSVRVGLNLTLGRIQSNPYLATMSQMMRSQVPKMPDVAMVCYLDLCKAAMYVPPTITDNSLRTLAPELAGELKVPDLVNLLRIVWRFTDTLLTLQHRIMDSPNEFWASHEQIDVNLYADLIVAIWRFDTAGAVRDVFPVCLALERSDAVKTTAVRALVTIVSEVGSFPEWLGKKLLTASLIICSPKVLSINQPLNHSISKSDHNCAWSIRSVGSDPSAILHCSHYT